VYLVGTAHVSKQSVEDVRSTIEEVRPDSVCVELCQGRYKSLVSKEAWEKMNIFSVLREGKSLFFLAQLVMSSFYRRLGKQFGVEPGAEMIEAVKAAEDVDARAVMADRDIEVTLKRVWGYLGFWNKMKMLAQVIAGLVVQEKIDEEMIEKMKKQDQLESIMAEFAEQFPAVKERLIDERDVYLAQKIRSAEGEKIVAVVGAGHLGGIEKHIQQEKDLSPLMEIPSPSFLPKLFKWGVPILIVGLLCYGFVQEPERGIENVYIWVLVNGISSAAGAAIALGHPLTIISAFLAAPLTSINPMMAAGFVAGIVQAYISKPTVRDFKDLPNAIETVKGWWKNPVIKILLVVLLSNLGSMLGTWAALFWIGGRSV
jgi:pheromone shutdown-related protein TraB